MIDLWSKFHLVCFFDWHAITWKYYENDFFCRGITDKKNIFLEVINEILIRSNRRGQIDKSLLTNSSNCHILDLSTYQKYNFLDVSGLVKLKTMFIILYVFFGHVAFCYDFHFLFLLLLRSSGVNNYELLQHFLPPYVVIHFVCSVYVVSSSCYTRFHRNIPNTWVAKIWTYCIFQV